MFFFFFDCYLVSMGQSVFQLGRNNGTVNTNRNKDGGYKPYDRGCVLAQRKKESREHVRGRGKEFQHCGMKKKKREKAERAKERGLNDHDQQPTLKPPKNSQHNTLYTQGTFYDHLTNQTK